MRRWDLCARFSLTSSGVLALASIFLLLISACSGGRPVDPGYSPLTISPSTATVLLGRTFQFTSANAPVTAWTVNGTAGGNNTLGTITPTGLYTAPTILPQN